ncbi:MAG TPA: carbamoyl-phosphate synthase large subunit, partial [Gaiellaceae bacterium]|nr:carbamoyl-phosphate synthase large subunit [Gaiellaceae bacterium]
SVGEVMAIGRTFPESLQKALRSLETGRYGLNCDPAEHELDDFDDDDLVRAAAIPTPERIFQIEAALRRFVSIERVHEATGVDPWFCDQILQIVEERERLDGVGFAAMTRADWRHAKQLGFSDAQLAHLWGSDAPAVRAARLAAGVRVTYKTVDTCAAEFDAHTPYHYGTYEDEDEIAPATRDTVAILGSGPNRIGQGVEFDYCCVHAAFALRDAGFETVMVNCNPETVSTDYDTSDRLYFEPLDVESVLAICERERPDGVVIQFGGQTPLKLARAIEDAGWTILGTPFDAVDLAEDRERFAGLLKAHGLRSPEWGIAASPDEAVEIAERIGYPVLVRPSYVLGGRAMRVCYTPDEVRDFPPFAQVLVDRFVESAVEVDVDALCDGVDTYVAAVMQHVEEAGVHSGDSACVLPAPSLSFAQSQEISRIVKILGRALGAVGLLNVQLAVTGDGDVYVLEANPRASRTVPFVSKATGVELVRAACRLALGARVAELGLPQERPPRQWSVKAAVLPFARFPGSDPVLGPEMRSTGEVMASAADLSTALDKAERAAGRRLPRSGSVFISIREPDHQQAVPIAATLAGLGFELYATEGTAATLAAAGIAVEPVRKLSEAADGEATVVDLIRRGRCDLVINTPEGRHARSDGYAIREAAMVRRVPCITTLSGAAAAVHAIAAARAEQAVSLQERIDAELGVAQQA